MVWTIEELVTETKIDQGLLENLRCLAQKERNPTVKLTDKEISNVQGMLTSLIGNMSINLKLSALGAMSGTETGISILTTAGLMDLSYRTRNLSKIEPDLDRIFKDFQAVQAGTKELNENEKITLKQYGILYDLATLHKTLEKYNQLGLIEGNAKLKKLYSQTQSAATMISHLDKTFNQEFRMPTGSVVLSNTQHQSQVYGKEIGYFEAIIAACVTKYSHASIGLAVDIKGKIENKISHINPTYKEEQFSLRNFLYSDVYKIKIVNLIDKDTQALLKEHLGNDWLQQLEIKFNEIEQQIHHGSQAHNHIAAEGGKIRSTQIATSYLQGGHKNYVMNDHSNTSVRDEVLGRGKWIREGVRAKEVTKLLCSEFVGKTIIAAIQELNDVVKQQLKEKGVKKIPNELIKNPIAETEKLHLLTPERLLNAMRERGAVEKVHSPNELSRFVTKGDGSNALLVKQHQFKAQVKQQMPEEEINDTENSSTIKNS